MSNFELYLKDISRIPLLSREEEIELAQKARSGDKWAKDKLVKANLRFVVTVAKRFQKSGMAMEDLVSEGNIGLMTAVENFDASRGNRLITFAVWWIKQSICKALGDRGRAIRLPLNKEFELLQIKKARAMLHSEMGDMSEEQEIEEIGLLMDKSPARIRKLLDMSRDLLSLDCPVTSQDNDSKSKGDVFFKDEESLPPDEVAINSIMKEDIARALDTLSPKESKVLRLRYGLDGDGGKTLQEIATIFGRSKERIRQIECAALGHLRQIQWLDGYVA
ncbi:MAG: RNA polymerase sigma factor RpoD/SigA [Treponema sp.]|nr:RNA polymerase sigma factor RpoD/SigA [Treponema sp.]